MTTPLELEAMAYDWLAVDGNLSSAIPDFLPIFTELNYLLVLKYV